MELTQRKYRDAVKAIRSLEGAGFATRLAGGCVRDRLLGREPADFDVATTAGPVPPPGRKPCRLALGAQSQAS